MKARNLSYMKEFNRKFILRELYKAPECRAELARRTNLTPAAISIITEELIEEGYILETASFGRKAMLEINADKYLVFGLQIGREFCCVCMTDFRCNLLDKKERPMDGETPDGIVDWAASCILEMTRRHGGHPGKILGVGVNAPGPVDSKEGVILNPPNFEGWHRYPVVERLKQRLPCDVFLEKNCLALYDNLLGWGNDYANMLHITMYDGIGGSVILNNQLVTGKKGLGGEIGHVSIDMHGPRCSCGNTGCLEMYASEKAILQACAERGGAVKSWKEIVDRAELGETLYLDIIRLEAEYLAAGIINVLNVLDLDAVLLTGFTDYHPTLLLRHLKETVAHTCIMREDHLAKISTAPIGRDSIVISAAAVVIYRLLRE